jgi:hypothetical protein
MMSLMDNEIIALQNNPLLLSKAVENSPSLTLIQKRTLLYIYAKVLDKIKVNGIDWSQLTEKEITVDMLTYDLQLDEMIKELMVGDGGNQTVQIWDQLENLHRTSVVLREKDGSGQLTKKSTSLVKSVETPIVASGKFRVELDYRIIRHIQYQEGVIYRFINLKYALALGSVNHLRMYEILKAVEMMAVWEVELEELKAMLHLQGQYPQFSHFRDWVLKTSQKALKEETDIKFTYSERRGARRRVTHILFKVRKNKIVKGDDKSSTASWAAGAGTAVYSIELDAKLTAKGIQHLSMYLSEGLTADHWDEALGSDIEGGKLVVEARDIRNRQKNEKEKVTRDKEGGKIIKDNKSWWLGHSDEYEDLSSSDAYLQSGKGNVILYSSRTFKYELEKYRKTNYVDAIRDALKDVPKEEMDNLRTGKTDRRSGGKSLISGTSISSRTKGRRSTD